MNREPVTIDNATGQVIEREPDPQAQGYVPPNSGAGDHIHQTGFGPTRKILDGSMPGAPWMTPEMAEQEMQIAGIK